MAVSTFIHGSRWDCSKQAWEGRGEWEFSSYAVPFSRAAGPQPSSPEWHLHRIRHLFGPYSSQMGNSSKAEIVLKENIGIQANRTLSAAQVMTSFLAWEHRFLSWEPFVPFFSLNSLEAQVSRALCQKKKKSILKETGGIPSLSGIYCLWTKWYKYGNRCVLGCSDGAGHPCWRWSLNE